MAAESGKIKCDTCENARNSSKEWQGTACLVVAAVARFLLQNAEVNLDRCSSFSPFLEQNDPANIWHEEDWHRTRIGHS
jgi:hypothetical protein